MSSTPDDSAGSSDDSDPDDVAPLRSMSSPTVRSPRMNVAPMMRPASSSMLRQPPAGAILRSQLAHLDDVRSRLLGLYPRPHPPLKHPSGSTAEGGAASFSTSSSFDGAPPTAASMAGSVGSAAPSPGQPSLRMQPPAVSPSSPELYKRRPMSPSSGSGSPTGGGGSTSLVDLKKLRRGSSKLQMLSMMGGGGHNKSRRKSSSSVSIGPGDESLPPVPEQALPQRANFADIMQRRNHQLKLLSELEKEKKRGAVVREAWRFEKSERLAKQREDEARHAEQVAKTKTPLGKLKAMIDRNRGGLRLIKKFDTLEASARADAERHRNELEALKGSLQGELDRVVGERESLAQQLQEAENAPDEIRRQMEERLSRVQQELLQREKELQSQRTVVERELQATHEEERKKIAMEHQNELTAMAAALAEKQSAMLLKQAELSREDVQRRVQELELQRAQVERQLQQQKESDLAAQKAAMTQAHLKELEDAKAQIAERELEVRTERDRLERQLEATRTAQGKSDAEKRELEGQLRSMQEQLQQNEADLRAHHEEVKDDIEKEEAKLREHRASKRSSDNLAIDRLESLLGQRQDSVQQLVAENEIARARKLGYDDAQSKLQLHGTKNGDTGGSGAGGDSRNSGIANSSSGSSSSKNILNASHSLTVVRHDDYAGDNVADALVEDALAGLGSDASLRGGDESMAPGSTRNLHPRGKTPGWKRLKNAAAIKLGGLVRLQESANATRRNEAMKEMAKSQSRAALVLDLAELKRVRKSVGGRKDSDDDPEDVVQLAQLDAKILNRSKQLKALQDVEMVEKGNPLMRLKNIVRNKKHKMAAMVHMSELARQVAMRPEHEARVALLHLKNKIVAAAATKEALEKQEHDISYTLQSLAAGAGEEEQERGGEVEGEQAGESSASELARELEEVRRKASQAEADIASAGIEATELIERTRKQIGTRLKNDREPLRVLRQAMANRWESEKMAVSIKTKQEKQRLSKLAQMKELIAGRQVQIRRQRDDQNVRMAEAERTGDVPLQNILMQQKQATDMQEMELNNDRKDIEARMREETTEAHEVVAESDIRGRIAEAMVDNIHLGFHLDDLERNDAELVQEACLIQKMPLAMLQRRDGARNNDEGTAASGVQRRLVQIEKDLLEIRAEKGRVRVRMQDKKREADEAMTEFDRQLVSRISEADATVQRLAEDLDAARSTGVSSSVRTVEFRKEKLMSALESRLAKVRHDREQLQRKREGLRVQVITNDNIATHLDKHTTAFQRLGDQEQDLLDREVQALDDTLGTSPSGLTTFNATDATGELPVEIRNPHPTALAEDATRAETLRGVEIERKHIEERRLGMESALKQDIINMRKLAADASEEQNKEIKLRCLRELTEMRHHIDDQESELTEQRELLRAQRRAIDVETPRMRQKHLKEISRVTNALQEREHELDDARRQLESQAQKQLAEVKAMNAKTAQRIREEAQREAMADAAKQEAEKLAQHAQEIDDLRLALDAKEKSLQAQQAAVMMQQSRARTMPIAHRWAQKQKLRTLQRKVEKEAHAMAAAKKALAAEAAKELEKMDKLAQDELKRQREEMAQLHLQDLDAANERIKKREEVLARQKEQLQVKEAQLLLEQEAPHSREQHAKELATMRSEIQGNELELNMQREAVQSDAAAEIEAVKEGARVAAEVAQMRMEKRMEAELLGQRLEMEAVMKKQRDEMQRQTNLLLEAQAQHFEDAAAGRVDERAEEAKGHRSEATLISDQRREALGKHMEEVEHLRERQVEKIEQLNEAANGEKTRMQEEAQDLERKLAQAVASGHGKGNNADQVKKLRAQLSTTITEIQNISQDHQSSLSALRAQGALEQAQERERHAEVMGQLSEEATMQMEGVDKALVDLDAVGENEKSVINAEVQHALDEMREKHIAYIAKMEDIIAERERQVVAARDRHISEQERLHRDRERDLQNALREVADRESTLQAELNEKRDDASLEQTKQLLNEIARLEGEKKELEEKAEAADARKEAAENDARLAYERQKEEIETQRKLLEAAFTEKETEFEVAAEDTKDAIKAKSKRASDMLKASLSRTSASLSAELLKIEREQDRVARESEMARRQAGLVIESKVIAEERIGLVADKSRKELEGMLEDGVKAQFAKRLEELETRGDDLAEREEALELEMEEVVVPMPSPRRRAGGREDYADEEDAVFENPFRVTNSAKKKREKKKKNKKERRRKKMSFLGEVSSSESTASESADDSDDGDDAGSVSGSEVDALDHMFAQAMGDADVGDMALPEEEESTLDENLEKAMSEGANVGDMSLPYQDQGLQLQTRSGQSSPHAARIPEQQAANLFTPPPKRTGIKQGRRDLSALHQQQPQYFRSQDPRAQFHVTSNHPGAQYANQQYPALGQQAQARFPQPQLPQVSFLAPGSYQQSPVQQQLPGSYQQVPVQQQFPQPQPQYHIPQQPYSPMHPQHDKTFVAQPFQYQAFRQEQAQAQAQPLRVQLQDPQYMPLVAAAHSPSRPFQPQQQQHYQQQQPQQQLQQQRHPQQPQYNPPQTHHHQQYNPPPLPQQQQQQWSMPSQQQNQQRYEMPDPPHQPLQSAIMSPPAQRQLRHSDSGLAEMEALKKQLAEAQSHKVHLEAGLNSARNHAEQHMKQGQTHKKRHLVGKLLHGARTAKYETHVSNLQGEIEAAQREQQQLEENLRQAKLDADASASAALAKGARKAKLKASLLHGLRATATQNRHKNHVDSLAAEIAASQREQEALQRTLEQAKVDAVAEAEEAQKKGERKAHLRSSLLHGLKRQARDQKHSADMQLVKEQAAAAAADAAAAAEQAQKRATRKISLKATLLNGLRKQAASAKHSKERTALQNKIAAAEQEKRELDNALAIAREEHVAAAAAAAAAAADAMTAMEEETARKLEAAKEEALNQSKMAHEKGSRKAHLRATLLAGLKKQAASAKHSSEKAELDARIRAAEDEKAKVDAALQNAKDAAATAAAEAAAAARRARKNRMKNALKSHLKSEKEKEKERLKSAALKQAALDAQNRAMAATEALEEAKQAAELEAEESANAFARQLRQTNLKGKLLAGLTKQARQNKDRQRKEVAKKEKKARWKNALFKKIRTDKEREADKMKLGAMKEVLRKKEEDARAERARLTDETAQKIADLEAKHELLRVQAAENARKAAEDAAAEKAKADRSKEVKGLFGKHRGSLLQKARQARKNRKAQEDLNRLMTEIENEKAEAARQAKQAKSDLESKMEEARIELEVRVAAEREQHAAELAKEAERLEKEKQEALAAVAADKAASLKDAEAKAKEELEGAVKNAKKRTWKNMFGKGGRHRENLKRLREVELQQEALKKTRAALEKEKQEADEQNRKNLSALAKLHDEKMQAAAAHAEEAARLGKEKLSLLAKSKRSRFSNLFQRGAAKAKKDAMETRWRERPSFSDMLRAGTKVAAVTRGWLLRRNFEPIRLKALGDKATRFRAAQGLQRLVRGMLSRRRVKDLWILKRANVPRVEASTNTKGYSHAVQQTNPAGALMLGDLQRTPSVDSLTDLDTGMDGANAGLLEEDSITNLDAERPRHTLYKYTAKKTQPASITAYDARFDGRDDLIDAALRTLTTSHSGTRSATVAAPTPPSQPDTRGARDEFGRELNQPQMGSSAQLAMSLYPNFYGAGR